MSNPSTTARALILRRGGAARSRDLVDAGIARSQVSRMVAAGELVRISRGVYAVVDKVASKNDDSVRIVAERVPNARLCLLTALRIHNLTTQAPFEVWVAIGNKDRAPRLDWPPLRVVRFSGKALSEGLELRKVDGRQIRVTSVAKTVADCFKFRNLIGLDVAIEALRDALRARSTTVDELWKYAHVNRVTKVMRPYIEALA